MTRRSTASNHCAGACRLYPGREELWFCLVDRDRNVTPYKIPRLKDLLEWGKDKVVFNFDNKYINTRGVSDEVRRASLDYYIKRSCSRAATGRCTTTSC